jgi:hypothetical protein
MENDMHLQRGPGKWASDILFVKEVDHVEMDWHG